MLHKNKKNIHEIIKCGIILKKINLYVYMHIKIL